MDPVSVSAIRTVPVGEDLRTESLGLSILRGLEKMHRVDKPLAAGESVVAGEWAVLGADGNLSRPGSTPSINTYLVFAGSDRFDSHATGQATLIMASQLLVKTNNYDTGANYTVGDYLSSKSLGSGFAGVTKATSGEFCVAKVVEVGDGYLVYETFGDTPVRKP